MRTMPSALSKAIQANDLDAVKAALDCDKESINLEMQCLRSDEQLPILELLLAAGPPSYAISTFLHNAAVSNRHVLLRAALAHPRALEEDSGAGALARAARHGRIESLRILLAGGARPITPKRAHGAAEEHPLVQAIEGGHAECVQALIEAGSELNFLVGDGDLMPLDLAQRKGRDDIAALLLAAGARGRTDADLTLATAARHGRRERLKELLPASSEEERGEALLGAAAHGRVEIVEDLLAAGVGKKALDDAVFYASQDGHLEVLERLLAAGGDPNVVASVINYSALMSASQNGHEKIVARLLAAGANPRYRDGRRTALDLAKDKPAITALLIRAGADPNAKKKHAAAVKAAVAGLVRQAWVPRVEGDGEKPLGARFGGRPWLGEGEAWPRTKDGRPLAFLLQIDLDALPEEARAAAGGGLLQVFFDVEKQPWDPFSSGQLTRIVRGAASRRGGLGVPPEGLVPFPVRQIRGWKSKKDTPFREDWARHGIELPDAAEEVLWELNVREDKLLGWGTWVQDPTYPRQDGVALDRVLLQITSERHLPIMLGDNGIGYVVQSSAEPDRVTFFWQAS
jgi:ankyrin repeat protein